MFLWKLGWPLDYYYHKSNIMKKRLNNYYKGEIYHIFNAVIHSTNRAHLEWPGWKRLWPVRILVHDGRQEAMPRGESTSACPSPRSLELELVLLVSSRLWRDVFLLSLVVDVKHMMAAYERPDSLEGTI